MLRFRSISILFSIPFILLCLLGIANGQQWSGVLDPSRAADWSQAGIPGGIPSGSWTQCGPTILAYGSSSGYASPSTIINALNHSGAGYTGCGSNTYVLLGAGDFYLNAAIRNQGVSNTELRGSGPQSTKLHFSGGSTCQGGNGSCLVGFESTSATCPNCSPSFHNWTSGYSKGKTSITLDSSVGIKVGDLIVADQCDTGYTGSTGSAACNGMATDNGNYFVCEDTYNPSNGTGCTYNGPEGGAQRAHRGQQEMAIVQSCSPNCNNAGSTTITIDTPLINPNWAGGQSPQVWNMTPVKNVGVQNLLIDATSAGSVTAGTSFYTVNGYWLRNVVIQRTGNIATFINQATHGQIESNYYYGCGNFNPGADASCINYIGMFTTLIDNNIAQGSKLPYTGNGPNAGNVIAYNFETYEFSGSDFFFPGLWDHHSEGANYNLYEGNVVGQFFQDQIHGTAKMETLYRNFITGFESCANNNCGGNSSYHNDIFAIGNMSYNRYLHVIGNVLGTPKVSTLYYSVTQPDYNIYNASGLGGIYEIGSGNGNALNGAMPSDTITGKTLMRWGNWDAFHGSTQWNASEVPSGISAYPNPVPSSTCTSSTGCPASFFLSGRPSWWSSSIPFPAIGPDVSNGNVGQCTGSLNTPGQYAGVAGTSSSQCTGTSLASAWGGHINAIPAMACFLNVMGGPPDGSGSILSFDANKCYSGSSGTGTQTPPAPSNLNGVVIQ